MRNTEIYIFLQQVILYFLPNFRIGITFRKQDYFTIQQLLFLLVLNNTKQKAVSVSCQLFSVDKKLKFKLESSI